ncbi:phage structural protein [Aureimonas sp. Leaf427]|uniref:phage structural protein n=1 Tax=Aureimonas sp. Leaf427 TaxID=1736375 RepID=UPI0039B72900
MSNLQTSYSFGNVTATLNGREVIGLWDGDDCITVEEGADIGSGIVGADGSTIFSQMVDRSATITLRVQHRSPIHAQLVRQLEAQRAGALDGIPFTVRDTDSNEGGACDKALIRQAPGTGMGKQATVRTWVLWTGNYMTRVPKE